MILNKVARQREKDGLPLAGPESPDDTPIEWFPISQRTVNALLKYSHYEGEPRARVSRPKTTAGEVRAMSDWELRVTENLGAKGIIELRKATGGLNLDQAEVWQLILSAGKDERIRKHLREIAGKEYAETGGIKDERLRNWVMRELKAMRKMEGGR